MLGVNFIRYRFGPAFYGNTFDRKKNFIWRKYHKECQQDFIWQDFHREEQVSKIASELREDSLAALLSKENAELSRVVSNYFKGIDTVYASVPQSIQESWAELIYDHIIQAAPIVEAYYGSYFQPYWISVQQTKPGLTSAASSFGWHIDDNPKEMLKLFIYLNDVTALNGAFRAFPRKTSRLLLLKGFRSGSEQSRLSHQKQIDDYLHTKPRRLKILEGAAGTVLAFDNNLVHKGTAPSQGFRHAIQIPVYPSRSRISIEQVREGLLSKRLRDYPLNPYDNDFGN